jgi:PAS domain S-box-containing protein
MLSELLHERAALYVAGAMTAAERDTFELLLEFHEDLRAHVATLQKVGAAVTLSRVRCPTPPPPSLRRRILASLDTRPRQVEPDPMVVTDPAGCIEWINPSFTQLCGHTLAEIKGRKPAQVLQGPETDPASVQRIRTAVHARRPCREQLLNYHKDGTRYRVEIAITPVLDDDGRPLWFVAKERKLALV